MAGNRSQLQNHKHTEHYIINPTSKHQFPKERSLKDT